MKQIYANNQTLLQLGRQGENLARQVVFDLSTWVAEYGSGVAELIYQRNGDAAPYPVAAVREGNTLVWTLTATDTAVASSYGSNGHCELRYYVGDVLAKSATWPTKVIPAMSTPSETAPPEPEQGWVNQVIAVGAAAKADADRAAALAAEVAANAAQTAQDATESAQAKEAAQTAQRLAEDAQRAAETAKQEAETAQAAAAQSATDADVAKQGAEAALKAAQDAAAAAAQSLADLRALYQEMQTWAQGVTQDINEAGSHAVQSVQSAGNAQVQRVVDEGTLQTANAKAQADAAALSAQQAAESAAVYDSVASDVTQLKEDIAANSNADAVTRRKLDALWKLNHGISYQFETDNAAAYQKTVPSGAKLASVENIGGKTVVWNQLVDNNASAVTPISGHKIVSCVGGVWVLSTADGSEMAVTGGTDMVFDLTQLFGSVNEPISSDDPRIAWVKQYAAAHPEYNAGELVSANVESLLYDDIAVGAIPNAVRSLPGYGWSAGNVHNSIERTETGWQYVQRVGNKVFAASDVWIVYNASKGTYYSISLSDAKYGEGVVVISDRYTAMVSGVGNSYPQLDKIIWLQSADAYKRLYIKDKSILSIQGASEATDGMTVYYPLAAPIITDITDLMKGVLDAVTVESGGALTFENAAKLSVPNSVEYAVKLSEVGA